MKNKSNVVNFKNNIMKLSDVKKKLNILENLRSELPYKTFVPEHLHVTEVSLVSKKFIDCGGTVRNERVINFQLWDANDFESKLKPNKLLDIIILSEKILGMEDLEIEVQYQDITIGKYDLNFNGENFELVNKKNCLFGARPMLDCVRKSKKNNVH